MALENIVRRQKYPCANRQGGCLELFSIEHIAEHQAVCVYREIKCPFQIICKCSWKGFKSDLKEHAKTAHTESYLEHSTFVSVVCINRLLSILSCFGELFTYHIQKKCGRYYAGVQLIGTSSEASKYKCEFTLRAKNGIEQISNTFLVQGYSENWETIFNSGKCLRLDEITVNNFKVGDFFHLAVKLCKV
jgi:hypothetical protein